MSTRRKAATVMLVIALGSAPAGAAHADAAKDCLYKFYNVTNNIRFDLALSRALLAEGEACLRDQKVQGSAGYGAIKSEAEKARAALANAERELASRKEAKEFYGEANRCARPLARGEGHGPPLPPQRGDRVCGRYGGRERVPHQELVPGSDRRSTAQDRVRQRPLACGDAPGRRRPGACSPGGISPGAGPTGKRAGEALPSLLTFPTMCGA